MTNSYLWTIDALDVAQTPDANTVTAVHWRALGSDGTRTVEAYNVVTLDPPGQSFIAYADLTKDTVLGWLWSKMPQADVEAALDAQLAALSAPPITNPPLPWS